MLRGGQSTVLQDGSRTCSTSTTWPVYHCRECRFLGAIMVVFLSIGYVLLRWLGRPSFRYVQPKKALSAQ